MGCSGCRGSGYRGGVALFSVESSFVDRPFAGAIERALRLGLISISDAARELDGQFIKESTSL
jgi:hypothetical protein